MRTFLYFRFIATESDILLCTWNERHLQINLYFYRISFRNACLLLVFHSKFEYIDFILHAGNLIKCSLLKKADYCDTLTSRSTNSHNKFVSEFYSQGSKGSRAFSCWFLRSFIQHDVWSAVEQRSHSLVQALGARARARATGIIFRRIQVRVGRSVGRSVPLPGLRIVDYASLPTSPVPITQWWNTGWSLFLQIVSFRISFLPPSKIVTWQSFPKVFKTLDTDLK